ncbi:hypothetical protein NW762_011075 [Fusarium torreyae]|uniref:TPR domain protein n=1 Tax=Fusarium torreyae TaxID=1237075 RepID=A0A9W8VA98_9HYPO|nr:hypothetical protein NW762_011075 [Fusarium torreyae]
MSKEYFNLGSHSRPVSTDSAEAQLWFDRGLIWAYSFNHLESVNCFERATKHDPQCAIAYWGIAYAIGPNYNKAWRCFDKQDFAASVKKANDAIVKASELASQASSAEQALIKAISTRFPPTGEAPEDLGSLDRAYADAMRFVYQSFGKDMDIAALFADALMCMTPRGLWNLFTGKPTGKHTTEARRIIELALSQDEGKNHPALCHMYIHMLEMSPFPELALPASDRLRYLVPEASHMLHMPTHIDAAVGDYRRSIDTNNQAIIADDKYFAREKASIQYVGYRVHYVCAKLYAAMMSGRFADAMAAADKLEEVIDSKLLAIKSPPMADIVESFLASKAHVLVRFGRWEDILRLKLPTDRELYCATTAIILYARGVAYSSLNRVEEAEATRKDFEAARHCVPRSRLNSIPSFEVDVLKVASSMLEGELEYRKGNHESGFTLLRKAIELEDALPYTDPPAWMQPVRHALGGLLMEQNRFEEAEKLFREDLGYSNNYPRRKAKLNNVWGLHGLYECLTRDGKDDEALFIKSAHAIAMASADVPVKASCFCRLSAVGASKCC